LAVEMAPASAPEILEALGRDALGLALTPEDLPDLFAVTAGGIDQDPRQLIVEKPYQSGPWKGGKVVIEYSRDLSYTRVSVHDRDGRRQRLYSVTALLAEAKPRTAPPAPSEMPAFYIWDDSRSAYVPVPPAAAAPKGQEALPVLPAEPVLSSATPQPVAPPAQTLIPIESDHPFPEKARPAPEAPARIIDVPIDRDVWRMRDEERKRRMEREAAKQKQEELRLSAFEKFSGPKLGRHWEYERRFVPGRNRFSQAPPHDFYIDEVDRAKKVHNIYFYAHEISGTPRVVAIERRRISAFDSDYGVKKEDQGHITAYP
jgi:hypothetical protein